MYYFWCTNILVNQLRQIKQENQYIKIKIVMKKITLLLAFCAFIFAANAQVILDETFDYSSASLMTESTWTNSLSSNSAAVGTIGNLSTGPLSYGDGNGTFVLSGLGQLVTANYTSGGNDLKVYKAIPAASSGVIYLSLLFSPAGNAQAQAQAEIMSLSIGGGNGPKVLVGKGAADLTKYRFATTRASSTSTDYRWGTNEYSDLNATYLLVVKYDWATSTSSVFVNPPLGSTTEPTPEAIDNNSAKLVANPIDGIRFRTTGSTVTKYQVSGVRVSTSWAAAVAKAGTSSSLQDVGSTLNIKVIDKTISCSETGMIQVYNLQGAKMLEAHAVSKLNTNLASGIYLVKLTNVNGQITNAKVQIK